MSRFVFTWFLIIICFPLYLYTRKHINMSYSPPYCLSGKIVAGFLVVCKSYPAPSFPLPPPFSTRQDQGSPSDPRSTCCSSILFVSLLSLSLSLSPTCLCLCLLLSFSSSRLVTAFKSNLCLPTPPSSLLLLLFWSPILLKKGFNVHPKWKVYCKQGPDTVMVII